MAMHRIIILCQQNCSIDDNQSRVSSTRIQYRRDPAAPTLSDFDNSCQYIQSFLSLGTTQHILAQSGALKTADIRSIQSQSTYIALGVQNQRLLQSALEQKSVFFRNDKFSILFQTETADINLCNMHIQWAHPLLYGNHLCAESKCKGKVNKKNKI